MELKLLTSRIEQCATVQKWAQTPDLKSLSTKELDNLASKLEDYWPSIPLLQRVRFTAGVAGAMLNAFPGLEDSESGDENTLVAYAGRIAEALLFEASPPLTWNGATPRNLALLTEAIADISHEIEADDEAGTGEKVAALAKEHNTAIEAGVL